MPLSQRRRPPPLVLIPRQTATPTAPAGNEEGPESPDSPDSVGTTPGPDSPDSPDSPDIPSSTKPVTEERKEEKKEETQKPSVSTAPATTSAAATSTANTIATSTTSTTTTSTTSTTATSTTALQPSQAASSSRGSSAPQITRPPSIIGDGANPPNLIVTLPTESPKSPKTPTSSLTLPLSPTSTGRPVIASGTATADTSPPQQTIPDNANSGGMSKGAEAALITFTVLGAVALFIGLFYWLRRRRRAKQEDQMRQAENGDPSDPMSNVRAPEMVHSSHITRSTTTNTLFAPGDYERPETVSTDKARSRIPDPQPTPNPFVDPPRNKAYDVLRGRPRSTTLTDRGSWIKNPFKDPVSDRFDPFGELQEKARRERLKYMEELQREQEYLEQERDALGVADGVARKGSGVTVEGLGVLDRSGDSRGYPR